MNLKTPVKTLVITAAVIAIFVPGFLKIRDLHLQNQDWHQKYRRLQAENELLKIELDRLENDQVFQEKILREKMGVVRKDEVPVKLVPQE